MRLKDEKTQYIDNLYGISVTHLQLCIFLRNILSKLVQGKKYNLVHFSTHIFFLVLAMIYLTKKSSNKCTSSTTFIYRIEASNLFFCFLWRLVGALRIPLGILQLSRLCILTSPKSNLTLPTYYKKYTVGIYTYTLLCWTWCV